MSIPQNARRKCSVLLLAAVLLSLFPVAAGEAASGRGETTLADILPPTTLCYMQRPAASLQRAGYAGSALRRLAAQPEMARFLYAWDASRDKFVREVAARANLEPAFVRSIFNGRLAAALVDAGMYRDKSGKSEFAYTLVIAVKFQRRPDQGKLFGAIRAMVEKWRQQSKSKLPLGKVAWQERYPGNHAVMMIVGASPMRFVLLGRTLLFYRGPRSEGLKTILADFDSPLGAKVLSRYPLYREALRGSQATPKMGFMYVNTSRLCSVLDAVGMPKVTRLLDVLGLRGVLSLGCAGGYRGEGIRHTLYLYAPHERRGLLKSLGMTPGAEAAAASLPTGTTGMLAARADLGTLYHEVPLLVDAVEQALGSRAPMGLAKLAGRQAIFGVSAREVLATLGDAVVAHPGYGGLVLRFDRVDCAAFTRAVVRMQRQGGIRFADLAVRGSGNRVYHVYYYNRSGKPLPLAPAFCIAAQRADGSGVVYVAAFPQPIKAVLRSGAAGVMQQDADYRRVSAGMGTGYGVFAYVDNRAGYARVYDNLLLPLLNAGRSLSANAPDPGPLPCGRDVVPFLFGCGVGISNDARGIAFTAYSPLGFGGFAVYLLDKLVVNNPAAIGMLAARLAAYQGGARGGGEVASPAAPGQPAGGGKRMALPGAGR